MPTVLIVEGYRFFFFSNEGYEPPHIHIEKGDSYAKWWLWVHERAQLAHATGCTPAQLRRMRELVIEHHQALMKGWHDYFKR